jgi:aminopeptidase N
MSAERKGSKVISGHELVVTEFEQKVPIPSYLLALVVGALESR